MPQDYEMIDYMFNYTNIHMYLVRGGASFAKTQSKSGLIATFVNASSIRSLAVHVDPKPLSPPSSCPPALNDK